jgi:hypothetical protein
MSGNKTGSYGTIEKNQNRSEDFSSNESKNYSADDSVDYSTEAYTTEDAYASDQYSKDGFSTNSDRSVSAADESSALNVDDLYEEGMEFVQGTLSFIKNNWMTILGAGAVIGVSAYVLRNRVPFATKSVGGKKNAKPMNSKNAIAKNASHRNARAHH